MREVYVVSCCRTAIGSFGGSLKDVPAPELGSAVIREAVRRAGIAPEQANEVMMGCAITGALGQNPARQASVRAGVPVTVPAWTVGMVCGSGMKAVTESFRAIQAGDGEILIAGGMENMSAAPYAVPGARWGVRMFDTGFVDTMVRDGLTDAIHNIHMGITAENICDQYGITRILYADTEESLTARCSLTRIYHLAGAGVWKADYGTPEQWQLLRRQVDK